jgi:hypothetical protein
MPTKASKAASRQSKLSRKKRREKIGPQQTDSGPVPVDQIDTEDSEITDSTASVDSRQQSDVAVAVAEVAPKPQATSSPAPRRRSARRPGLRVADVGNAQVYKHLGSELRQIGIISVIIAAILVTLAFVLG